MRAASHGLVRAKFCSPRLRTTSCTWASLLPRKAVPIPAMFTSPILSEAWRIDLTCRLTANRYCFRKWMPAGFPVALCHSTEALRAVSSDPTKEDARMQPGLRMARGYMCPPTPQEQCRSGGKDSRTESRNKSHPDRLRRKGLQSLQMVNRSSLRWACYWAPYGSTKMERNGKCLLKG